MQTIISTFIETDFSTEFWSFATAVTLAFVALWSKHFRYFMLFLYKVVKELTRRKPRRK